MKSYLYKIIVVLLLFTTFSFMEPRRFTITTRLTTLITIRPLSPGGGYVWIEGEWFWNGRNYVWRDGYWSLPLAGYTWTPGYWKQRGHGWHWRSGHWRR